MVYVSYQTRTIWGHFGNAQIPNGHATKKEKKINSALKKFRPELDP